MFRNTAAIAGIALASAVAATGASAHDSYGHSHYSTVTTPTYGSTYTAPTVNLGPIEQVQPNSTVQYVQPSTSYIQPATTSTYTAPAANYTTPSYAAQPTYQAPTYAIPSYATPTYQAPSYSTTYSTPSYVQPTVLPRYYDGTDRVRTRMDRLRSRIGNALNRGDLRGGEQRKLRRKMREIRQDFRAYKANDGIIDQAEHAALDEKMSRQSRRIRKLANNHRTAGPLVSPYGPGYTRW